MFDRDIVHDDRSHDIIPKWAFHTNLMKLTEVHTSRQREKQLRVAHMHASGKALPNVHPRMEKDGEGGLGAQRLGASSEMGSRSCVFLYLHVCMMEEQEHPTSHTLSSEQTYTHKGNRCR